ncbi:MAG: tRNA pseudouridine(55) synthase TruB [Thermodesulfobacteriota bacterium]
MRVDGLLIVDKPEGITSLEVVREVKRRFFVKKAGHIGTLDPFATGVLPIVINEGTKLVPFLGEEPKEYEAIMKLGEETTTDDPTGEVVFRKPWEEVSPGMVHASFQTFLGRIQQTPSMFSAIKVNGKPLYRWARRGIEVERKAREVEIFGIQIKEVDFPLIRFKVLCSKGTYIRTLGRDIGRKIGCGAHLLHLRRVRSGPFTLEQAIPWETLKGLSRVEDLYPWLISLREALPSLPEVVADGELVKKVRFGREMMVRDFSPQVLPAFEKGQWLKMSSPEEGLVAILKLEVKDGDIQRSGLDVIALRPLRVFQSSPPLSPHAGEGKGEGEDHA